MLESLGSQLGCVMALTFVIGIVLVYGLARFYRDSARRDSWSSTIALTRLDISLRSLGGFSLWRLVLVSVLGLFLELLLIRWVSSEIRIFAYFKNFVLIACFLGFGLGCQFCRRRINLAAMLVPLTALAVLIKFQWLDVHNMWTALPTILGTGSEVNIWGVPNLPMSWSVAAMLLIGLAVVAPLFALVAFVFVPIGQMVGWYLENAPSGGAAYTWNVLASIAGIVLYTGLCFAYQPPWVWLLTAGLLLMILLWRQPRLMITAGVAFFVCIQFAILGPAQPARVYWSPYQKLTVSPFFTEGESA